MSHNEPIDMREDHPTAARRADPHDLDRFVRAQEDVYRQALAEIRSGRKRSHWMWFIFPQFKGLGRSLTSERYAIASGSEAAAYLAHAVLGLRLVECAEALLALEGLTAHEIFGSPDDLKLRSSATLFASVSDEYSVFHRVLDKYFGGQGDAETRRLMSSG
jgi:uncharacterized protein (DUF1810 family)